MNLASFREIWCVDFEFHQSSGELPSPICLVATELNTGRWVRLFRGEMPEVSPYALDENSLFVAFAAAAELSCHLALGWELPHHVIDLFAEFRNLTNSIDRADQRANLLSALAHFGIPHISSDEKNRMRDLATSGVPWSPEEKVALLEYCQSDVAPLGRLLDKFSKVDTAQALDRGRYAKAVAMMEYTGIPVDVETLGELRRKWRSIHLKLIAEVDQDFHVFDGVHFKFDRFARWIDQRKINWPRTPTGRLSVDTETFRAMALTYPELNPLKELRATLSSMKLESLAIGHDGRNRVSLKSFASLSGRNQPSTSAFIFGPAVWLRYLIKPRPGNAVAYIDFAQQEFAIAAVLSGDRAMQEAYRSSDPYLEFAKQAGAAPPDATKNGYSAVRDQYKACALAVMYGMQARSLSQRIGKSELQAEQLIEKHRRTYPKFWEWTDRVLANVQFNGSYSTRSGWSIRKNFRNLSEHHKRSVRNFPVQATGADLLRLACCIGVERGIKICAPVHDAVLIEAPLEEIAGTVSAMQQVMAEASKLLLDGFEVRTEAKVFTDRFEDARGESTWRLITELLGRCLPEQEQYPLLGWRLSPEVNP